MSRLDSRLRKLEEAQAAEDAQQAQADPQERHAAWLASLSRADYEYQTLQRLNRAAKAGLSLNHVRCPHQIATLFRQGSPTARERLSEALHWLIRFLERRHTDGRADDDPPATWATVLDYLGQLTTHPDYLQPGHTFCAPQQLRVMFPLGVSAARLAEAEEWQAWPKGRPLPPCPLCHPQEATDEGPTPLRVLLATLSLEEQATLYLLGCTVALRAIDGTEPPTLDEQARWLVGTVPVPPQWQEALEEARASAHDQRDSLMADDDAS